MSGSASRTHASTVDSLVKYYDRIFADAGPPPWAWEWVKPTVPFVGRRYGATGSPRILVYASAENLSWLDDSNVRDLARYGSSPRARDRHRRVFWEPEHAQTGEAEPEPSQTPYTGIGIEPFDNGGLLCAAALLWLWELRRLTLADGLPTSSHDLVESIAVANLSKFTRKPAGNRNVDVRGRELEPSLEYVLADLEVLKPSLVLFAKPGSLALLSDRVDRMTVLVETYQHHTRVVHACRRRTPNCGVNAHDVGPDIEAVEPLLEQWGRLALKAKTYMRPFYELLRHQYRAATRSPPCSRSPS